MSQKRNIRKVAVLGSGVMGSRIACHFANIGLEVLLLDIVDPKLSEEEAKSEAKRNSLVNSALTAALKSNPSPIYRKSLSSLIETGNFDDDLERISECDWVLEAIIENLDIKKSLYEKVEKYRKEGTVISSNTSSIPMKMLVDGRSEDFKAKFVGTHFFNPPRYLRLLEIIPGPDTDPELLDFMMHYGDLFLGKTTVLCKDTPAFIANRVGVFGIMATFKLMKEYGLSVEDVDSITGPISGRPKSATFRTCDLVGLDTLAKVANGVQATCPEDEMNSWFALPDYLKTMIDNGWIGDKAGQGFYKKSKDAEGNRVILALDLDNLEYKEKSSPRHSSIGEARQFSKLSKKVKHLYQGTDSISKFFKDLTTAVLIYSANRIPEIADNPFQVDDALRAGFGWEAGPFELWDMIGFGSVIAHAKEKGYDIPEWISEMEKSGSDSFYSAKEGKQYSYLPSAKQQEPKPGTEAYIKLDNFRNLEPVYKNKECTVHDIGDGVLCLEFHTKMNAIGSGILQGINKTIDIAENGDWKGLVIGNDATNFSAGANLAMMLMLAIEQEYDELNMAISYFQNTVMRLRYSAVPVVMAPHGMTLGGGCEMSLHADSTVAAAETYIGLVEVGAGLIPGGGGTKEFVLRVSDGFSAGDPQLPSLQERFTTIATAKVATSAHEAFDIGVLHDDKDEIVINIDRQIADAKNKVIELYDEGYTQPARRSDIKVLGRTALGALYSGVEAFGIGNYASEHDQKIARKLAYIMAGGDLSEATMVTEQYLLDLEREAFLSLLGERKTLERMQHILKTGKPLRN
ncbi:3-hydroxyacyl-CoA dehydrogenase [bacterium]|nr:3-hydroxyacyl-CoA dehydrogenase [bacterium]